MRTNLLFILVFFLVSQVYAQQETKEAVFINYQKVLMKNLKYPSRAIDENLQGTCKISFKVYKDGKIDNFKIISGVVNCPECDEEAIRVLKLMKKWKPAEFEGNPIESEKIVSINFKID